MTDGAMVDVTRVERVTFSDTKLALDLNGNAGQAAKLLGALGGSALLGNKGVVGEVLRLLDAGVTGKTIAGIGLQLLGASTPTQITQTLWSSVVSRAGTDSELKLLTDLMAGGISAAALAVMAGGRLGQAVSPDLPQACRDRAQPADASPRQRGRMEVHAAHRCGHAWKRCASRPTRSLIVVLPP